MCEIDKEMALTVFESVCSTLDNMSLKYDKAEDSYAILLKHKGDEFDHKIVISVDSEKELIHMSETLPFSINPEKALEFAIASCYVNSKLLSGKFVYDMNEKLSFNLTQIYSGSLVGEATIKKMVLLVAYMVEEFDDKFMALNKGYLKFDDFK